MPHAESRWREPARKAIRAALADADRWGAVELKRRLKIVSQRYPFGRRENHPYRIWLDEVARLVKGRRPRRKKRREYPGQLLLFEIEEQAE